MPILEDTYRSPSSPRLRGRRSSRAANGLATGLGRAEVGAALASLPGVPLAVGRLEELVPVLAAACAPVIRGSRLGLALLQEGALRLAPGSFGSNASSGMAWNVDADGAPDAALAASLGIRRHLDAPLVHGERRLGLLLLADKPVPYAGEDRRRLKAIAPAVAATVETTERLLAAREEAAAQERSRLADDLHDTPQQILYAAEATLGAVMAGSTSLEDGVHRAHDLVVRSMEALSELVAARTAPDQHFCDRLAELGPRLEGIFGVPVELRVSVAAGRLSARLSAAAARALARVAREAATNALKHARPTRVTISLTTGAADVLRLTVADDGAGFAGSPPRASGYGLPSLRRSVEACGGRLAVSSAPGAGTCVVAEVGVSPLNVVGASAVSG
ncbi:MAG: hypothetical protein IRZ07_06345 [Microbispora sp.]|nr:hypothetical protein [Microbispora sp.]